MDQVSIKYTIIFHYKALPKFGFLVWKQTIWQPCHSQLLDFLISIFNLFSPVAFSADKKKLLSCQIESLNAILNGFFPVHFNFERTFLLRL
jgi:hypothetical protein